MKMDEMSGMRRVILLMACTTILVFTITMRVAAQTATAQAVYEASATVSTNVEGVRTFPAPPAGFDPLSASELELAAYGFPPRPASQVEAGHYAKWANAMAAAKNRWNGALKVTSLWNTGVRLASAPAGAIPEAAPSAKPTTGYAYNWSGFVNTNTLTKWNPKTSFYYVVSDFNVPTAQQAFNGSPPPLNICDGGWDVEVSWNGIDGFSNPNALLQGGTLSAVQCVADVTATTYYAWIEWYPSYPVLTAFPVNPGDDFYVETWDTSSKQGYVFLDDLTTQTYSIYAIQPLSGQPGLIGNSAEYIVERPSGTTSLYPLANYIQNFWATSFAYNFFNYNHGLPTPYFPGSMSPSTWLLNMVNDEDTQVISFPEAEGNYGIFFQDENCALSGGCVP